MTETLQQKINDLLLEIKNNVNKDETTFDDRISEIKKLIQKHKLSSNQTTRYLKWCNIDVPLYRKNYLSNLGVYVEDNAFINILDIAHEIGVTR